MIETKGTVEDIIYRNQENLYTVFTLDTEDGYVTVVGKILDLNKGDILSVSGDLVFHKDYGEQIQLKTYEKIMPSSVSQIEKYLSSGIISNIGPKRAKQIVDRFAEDTLDIMSENPDKLLEIPGIGKATLKKIIESFEAAQSSRQSALYLQKFELGPKLSSDIYAKYKEKTREVIEENPYQLIDDIRGLGFNTADKMAKIIGIGHDSEFRIRAGIIFVLAQAEAKDGDCFLYYDDFLSQAAKTLNVDPKQIDEQIPFLVFNNRIKINELDDKEIIYLRMVYDTELSISQNLLSLLKSTKKFDGFDLDYEIENVEKLEEIEYSESQKKAIKTALEEKLMIITGGPGTGKTTLIKAIIMIAKNLRLKFTLCAPTGRAAKRMEESTGQESSTIHRLLGYKSFSEEMLLDFNEENPLDADLVIVDEVSMVDIYLMNNLLKAIKKDAMLIFVGDADQLPSVGPGNVLTDMIDSGIIPTIKLDTIFRQGEGSNITKNAHLINQGKQPILNEANKDFFFLQTRSDAETLETLVDLVAKRLPDHYKMNPTVDIQVLTPSRRGLCGVESINERLQRELNPPEFNKLEFKMRDKTFRDGDKVMQTKNNYDIELKGGIFDSVKGVFNGDIGYIKNVFPATRNLEIDYDGRTAKYTYKEADEITHAYCTTIHKSQGSEFPIVVIPMASTPYMLLTRNILYTGITRGKSVVVLVGSLDIMRRMIRNTNERKRNSTLDHHLKKYNI